ncbi:MAG: tetratricopeptide repeat protein [Deltaproteobacteria bacterium]|nr:tetratricopeptide repeat protein [Deltaproteobacteria bacterium]
MEKKVVLALVAALAFPVDVPPANAQPAGLSKPPLAEEEVPRDLAGFVRVRTKAAGRIGLQEKRVEAAGKDAAKKARAVMDLAQQHWDLSSLCENELLSGFLEKGLEDAGGDQALVLELKSRQAEVSRCIPAHRQVAVDLLSELAGSGDSSPLYDEVLFYLAWYEFQVERKKDGLGHLKTLLEKFPQSPFAPEGWLLVGEFYFELSAIEKAVDAYRKVTADPKNRLYPFALYKLSWCHFNLAEYETALRELVQVVNVAGESPHWASLAREAADSLPYFYAEIGKPEAALEFFRKVDSARLERLVAKLALVYHEQGKLNESIAMCRTLLEQFPKSDKVLGYRLLLVKNQGARGDSSALVAEFESLADSAGAGKPGPGLLEEARSEVVNWITLYEKERSPAKEVLIQRLKAVQQKLAP